MAVRFPHLRRTFRGVTLAAMLATMAAPAAIMLAQPASAASLSANLDQCRNGGVGPPIVLHPCLNGTLGGTSFSQYVNGNAGASDSHWKEGQFIAYRAVMSGLAKGSHTLVFNYHTVDGSKHAIDYVGSYDATETTSPT